MKEGRNSVKMTFLKRQNYRGGKQVSGFQRQGVEGGLATETQEMVWGGGVVREWTYVYL